MIAPQDVSYSDVPSFGRALLSQNLLPLLPLPAHAALVESAARPHLLLCETAAFPSFPSALPDLFPRHDEGLHHLPYPSPFEPWEPQVLCHRLTVTPRTSPDPLGGRSSPSPSGPRTCLSLSFSVLCPPHARLLSFQNIWSRSPLAAAPAGSAPSPPLPAGLLVLSA